MVCGFLFYIKDGKYIMKQPEVEPLFATPLYINEIEDTDTRKYVDFVETLNWHRNNDDEGQITHDGGYLLHQYDIFNDLRVELEKHLRFYVERVCGFSTRRQEFYITNSWAVKHQKNEHARNHIHNNSFFSGVLYIKCDNDSPPIRFYKNPLMQAPTSTVLVPDREFDNMFNAETYGIPPSPGRIIFFPSHIEHGIDKSESENTRLSIAFNTFVRGEFGEVINKVSIR